MRSNSASCFVVAPISTALRSNVFSSGEYSSTRAGNAILCPEKTDSAGRVTPIAPNLVNVPAIVRVNADVNSLQKTTEVEITMVKFSIKAVRFALPNLQIRARIAKGALPAGLFNLPQARQSSFNGYVASSF
ncbi:MAG: hypothetical protein J4F49_08310 [Rhodobacteraceae bacterium]|nr:hypothetical protein [Paracoccaceae bacterium]